MKPLLKGNGRRQFRRRRRTSNFSRNISTVWSTSANTRRPRSTTSTWRLGASMRCSRRARHWRRRCPSSNKRPTRLPARNSRRIAIRALPPDRGGSRMRDVELVGLPSHNPADRAAPRLARLRQRDHSHDAIRSPPPWRSKLSRSTRNAIFSDMSLRSRRASKGGSGNWASKSWSARPAARAWSAPWSWSRTRRRERISIPRSAPPRMWASARRRTA